MRSVRSLARVRVDAHDRLELLAIAQLVVAALVNLRDLEARLDGRLDRLRVLLHVARIDIEGAIRALRLLVEVSGQQQRLGAQLGILGLAGDALVLGRGLRQLAGLAADEGDLLGRFLVELVLGIGAPEVIEHFGGGRPVLQAHQRRTRVVLGAGADLRRRRPPP